MQTIRNILVPVDFSEASTEAAHFAASLAQAYNARLNVLHVKEKDMLHWERGEYEKKTAVSYYFTGFVCRFYRWFYFKSNFSDETRIR